MKYIVLLENDYPNGYGVVCPDLPGCVTCGDTKKEALKNMKEAITLYLYEETPPKPSTLDEIKTNWNDWGDWKAHRDLTVEEIDYE